MVNETIVGTAVETTKSALPLILEGLKKIAQGISYFIYLPLKMAGLQPTMFLMQLIYLTVLGAIIYKLSGSLWVTVVVLVLMLFLGALL